MTSGQAGAERGCGVQGRKVLRMQGVEGQV